jgi:hypothetical protein
VGNGEITVMMKGAWDAKGNKIRSLPRTHVLGYSQPSLRDSIWKSSSHADSGASAK